MQTTDSTAQHEVRPRAGSGEHFDVVVIAGQIAAARSAGGERDVHESEDTHVAPAAAATEGA